MHFPFVFLRFFASFFFFPDPSFDHGDLPHAVIHLMLPLESTTIRVFQYHPCLRLHGCGVVI